MNVTRKGTPPFSRPPSAPTLQEPIHNFRGYLRPTCPVPLLHTGDVEAVTTLGLNPMARPEFTEQHLLEALVDPIDVLNLVVPCFF